MYNRWDFIYLANFGIWRLPFILSWFHSKILIFNQLLGARAHIGTYGFWLLTLPFFVWMKISIHVQCSGDQ